MGGFRSTGNNIAVWQKAGIMNKCIMMGRLTRDPETKVTDVGVVISKFAIAIADVRSKDEHVDFINVTAFGKTGEFVDKYFEKGMRVLIEGRWHSDNFKNADGDKFYTNDLYADSVEFADTKIDKKVSNPENETKKTTYQPKQKRS